MLSNLFLSVLPPALLGLFSLSLIAELFWRIFARTRSLSEASNITDAEAVLRLTGLVLLCFSFIVLPTALPVSSVLQSTQSSISCALLALISLLGSRRYRHPDIIVFILFTAMASIYLLNASDVLTIFFVLELLNSLVLYSFFFTANYSAAGQSNSAARIASSCVYQFTLNFFSSIALYTGMVSYLSLTGGSALGGASVWVSHHYASASLSLFIAAFLLKFGTGPWVFFKINVYRNMNFQLVLLYSVVYMLVIFILFLNLIFVFGAALGHFASAAISSLVIAASALFGGFAFQNPNIFVFISFSSLINISVFVLQAVSVA